MKRKKDVTGLKVYYDAMRRVFEWQSGVMSGVLPHYGERGRNDEERLRQFLKRVLPCRFSIGSGFIVSSDLTQDMSSQIDITIFDQFWNSPLYRELVAEVYPIETVYAVIEVKGLLDKYARGRKERKSDLDRALESIAKIRCMSENKKYVRYVSVPKTPGDPTRLLSARERFTISLPPRAYIFAYTKRGWRTLEDFSEHLAEKLRQHPGAHIHGVVIVEKDWFVFQEAYASDGPVVHAFEGDALLRFTNTLLRGIQSMPMAVASIDDYHRAGLFEGVKAGDPRDPGFSGEPEPPDACDDQA